MELHGKSIIGGQISDEGTQTFSAVNPAAGEKLPPAFHDATDAEICRAAELAGVAFAVYRRKTPEQIAAFIETIAAEIMALGDELLKRANAETALPEARLTGERARTAFQLTSFAALVREGSWVDARIERAQADRKPARKPGLRRMLVPIGPVVVFGAGNFPFAYSVAGVDTAAALAAGNPVVVKAHPAHPGVSEMVMRAVQKAVEKCAMPAGIVSMLHGASTAVGMALVKHPAVKAVGFTGSLQGGRALFDAAAGRPEPIPVYAEMGSTNPVFILPGALAQKGAEIAQGLVQSVTLGVGQFCTKPGVVVGVRGPAFDDFLKKVAHLVADVPPGTMLHSGICAKYHDGVQQFQKMPGVKLLAKTAAPADAKKTQAPAVVFTADADTFLTTPRIQEELFGPSTVIVACESAAEMLRVAEHLRGQLTATVHSAPDDAPASRALVETLTQKAGRVISDGFPTGVEVCPAMQHGGPYPATTNALFGSVGTAAILRFARPVSYQDFAQDMLPPQLQDKNVMNLWRQIDGQLTKADVGG